MNHIAEALYFPIRIIYTDDPESLIVVDRSEAIDQRRPFKVIATRVGHVDEEPCHFTHESSL